MILRSTLSDVHVTIPKYAHTLDGFREWVVSGDYPEFAQVAYLETDVLVDMSPERWKSHNKP